MQPQAQPNQFLDHLNFRPGITDIPCPVCGPNCKAASNRRRKVLRVWNNDGFITYNCARCGAQGVATDDKPRPATPMPKIDDSKRRALAEQLWGMSVVIQGTPVEAYLRSRGCYTAIHSLRYLPPADLYHPTMIAKFQGTSAVHLTRLMPDGFGKAGTDHDKVMIGPVSGFPIVIRSTQWSKPLIICEGIEDGLSLALAFPDWNVWAAGSAGHISKLVPRDRPSLVVVDYDTAGIKAAKRCFEANPEVGIFRFPKGLDANAILVQRGLNALKDFVCRSRKWSVD